MEEAGKIFRGIFSRLTLGTGPLAVKAIAAGVRYSPKAFRLLATAAQGIGKAAGWIARHQDFAHAGGTEGEEGIDHELLAKSLQQLQQVGKMLEADPREARRLVQAMRAALEAK